MGTACYHITDRIPALAELGNRLFKHVGLDLAQMATLGKHSPDQPLTPEIRRQIDERIIRSGSASNAMSRKFENWWEQRHIKFHYTFDGRYFRILVSDDLDESPIELDQRSAGMQYFFSFYLVFQVEAQGAHANSILLLDDPGKDLHPTAQAKIVEPEPASGPINFLAYPVMEMNGNAIKVQTEFLFRRPG